MPIDTSLPGHAQSLMSVDWAGIECRLGKQKVCFFAWAIELAVPETSG